MIKVSVPYEHDPADLSPIWLAVLPRGTRPGGDDWKPALRDTVAGRRVVYARFEDPAGVIWIRTKDGQREATGL
jgi:hypothetical protein